MHPARSRGERGTWAREDCARTAAKRPGLDASHQRAGLPPHSESAKVGSLGAFWPLLEPVLDALAPRRVCEIGVEDGAFGAQLLAWCEPRECAYAGIDPAPPDVLPQRTAADAHASGVIRGTSLDVLPKLEACDAYFIDGDHNYYTVRGELDAIARATRRTGTRGPLICVHDVGWPWGRRDMYYAPESIPAEHRHPYSNELGVTLHDDALVDGGMRDPRSYAIACRAGGARNGVLTAVEDFLADAREAGAAWQMVLVPAAFGLAVLFRPDTLPDACAQELQRLRASANVMGGFLRLVERNYMSLYLFGEDAKRHITSLEKTYAGLFEQYNALQSAYADLLAHSDSLLDEYDKLRDAYRNLEAAARTDP